MDGAVVSSDDDTVQVVGHYHQFSHLYFSWCRLRCELAREPQVACQAGHREVTFNPCSVIARWKHVSKVPLVIVM